MTRFGIAIPQFFADGAFSPETFKAYLARAEQFGFDSGWTQEQILGSMPMLSPLETMTFAAACTERLRLGCVVFVSSLHSPVHLAKSISTLDQMSRGRLEVGVSAGGGFRPFAAFGVERETFVARFNEGLQLMKHLWSDQTVTFEGKFWQLQNAGMEPKPFQKPHPPIWFGASHPAALRRAVRYGDGFFGGGSTTTAQFAQQVPIVRQALAEAGRDAGTFRIAKRIYIAVDDDTERARKRVTDGLHAVYADLSLPDIEKVAVYGHPDECVRGVREVVDAGAELVLFTPFEDKEGSQMTRLATEVMPKLS